ncbi:hypothetical protein QBC46DRAFT_20498 [Diplogelasinospora grovesii]|uniref:Uncharacterized protein n=1 Tax=Diplogelasinospora grovesii TaxID=303347 RepID=A0AAN6N0E4_9PEZI|nr:hypothetical protein QBC46DRAFT_20498 [Diplogelasinospora grovesii]
MVDETLSTPSDAAGFEGNAYESRLGLFFRRTTGSTYFVTYRTSDAYNTYTAKEDSGPYDIASRVTTLFTFLPFSSDIYLMLCKGAVATIWCGMVDMHYEMMIPPPAYFLSFAFYSSSDDGRQYTKDKFRFRWLAFGNFFFATSLSVFYLFQLPIISVLLFYFFFKERTPAWIQGYFAISDWLGHAFFLVCSWHFIAYRH